MEKNVCAFVSDNLAERVMRGKVKEFEISRNRFDTKFTFVQPLESLPRDA